MAQMKKITALPLLISLVLCIFLVNGAPADEAYKGESTVLTALKTDETIIVDGEINEDAWAEAKKLIITVLDGGIGIVDVEMQALYDADYIYIHAAWDDPTESVSKGIWTFNNSGWTASQDEDRISIFWNINDSIEGFNVGGCAMLCHGDRMHTNDPNEMGDSWHWKSARTNPAGYSDDKFINHTPFLSKEYEGNVWTARYGDAEISGSYKNNINNDKSGPKYYEPSPNDAIDAKFIFKTEIDKGEAVEITPDGVFSEGTTVPGFILERPQGSRGDIDAKGAWNRGRWNLEFKRKLDTGHDDDVQFDITKTYRFGIAIMDNTGGFEAYGEGHSFDLGARTLEFGGLGSEEITQMALIRDYLVAARAYSGDGKTELAYSEINNALGLYNEIQNVVASKDPEHHVTVKKKFGDAKREPSIENIDFLIEEIDHTTLTLQGKREATEPSWNVKLIVLWGKVQIYVLILLAMLALFPVLKSIQVGRKPELRNISIFLLIVTIPILLEGIGRIGILTRVQFLQNLSFMTNEYATLLWAMLMTTALFLARAGFGEVDRTIKSLESYGIGLEQKVVERTTELKRSEEKYRSLIETMNDGVGIISKDHTMTFANKRLGEILGYRVEEIIGKDTFKFLDEANKDRLDEELEKRAGGEASIYELLWTTKTGKRVPTLVSAAPLFDEKNNYTGSFAVITDITERKRFEQQLRQSEKLAATGQLAASIAHEINNPLSGIKNCIYILMDEIGKDDSGNYLEMADKELDRIARIVKQLLDFYRPAKQTMTQTDINDVIEDVLKFMEAQLKKQKVKVSKKLDPKLPKIMASGEQLKQVFMNLIINAQEAMPMGGKLNIKTILDNKNIKIEFKDNGYGIPDDELEKLFDPFFSTKKEGKGTGLGLSVSYGIIRAHNGMVEVWSEEGKGTSFTITLPVG
jgi:PAS domain S-box-containing protein